MMLSGKKRPASAFFWPWPLLIEAVWDGDSHLHELSWVDCASFCSSFSNDPLVSSQGCCRWHWLHPQLRGGKLLSVWPVRGLCSSGHSNWFRKRCGMKPEPLRCDDAWNTSLLWKFVDQPAVEIVAWRILTCL